MVQLGYFEDDEGKFPEEPKETSKISDHHQYTVEVLYHFTCGSCEAWWSYAVTPFIKPYEFALEDKAIYCPHCGHTQKTKIKEGYRLEKNLKYHRIAE